MHFESSFDSLLTFCYHSICLEWTAIGRPKQKCVLRENKTGREIRCQSCDVKNMTKTIHQIFCFSSVSGQSKFPSKMQRAQTQPPTRTSFKLHPHRIIPTPADHEKQEFLLSGKPIGLQVCSFWTMGIYSRTTLARVLAIWILRGTSSFEWR